MEGTRRSSEFVNPKLSRRPTPFVLVGRPSSISLCSERSFARARGRANVVPFAGSNIDVSETSIVSLGSPKTTCKPRLASLDDTEVSEEPTPIVGRFVTKSSLRILPPLVETLPSTILTDQVKKLPSEDTLSSRSSKVNTSQVKAGSIHSKDKKGSVRSNVCKNQTKQVNKGRAVASHHLAVKKLPVAAQKKPVSRVTEKLPTKKIISVIPPIPKKKAMDIANVAKETKTIENKVSSSSLSESSRDDSVNSSKDDNANGSTDTKNLMKEIQESCDDESDIPSVSTRCSPISATLTNASDPLMGDEINLAKSHARFDVLPTLNRRKPRTASRIRSPSISDNVSSRRILRDDHNEAANRRFSIGDWNKQKAINLRRGSLRPSTQVDFIECQRIFSTDRHSSNSKHNSQPFSSNVKTQNLPVSNYLKAKHPSHNKARSKSLRQLPHVRKTCGTSVDNDIGSRKSRNRDLIQTLVNDEAADSSASKSVSIGSHSDSPCTSPSSPSLLVTRPLTVFSTSVSAAVTPVNSSACSQVLTTALTPISATSTSSCHVLSPTLMSSAFSLQPPSNSSCEPGEDLRSGQSLSSVNINSPLYNTSVNNLTELSHFTEKVNFHANKEFHLENVDIMQSHKQNDSELISNIKEPKTHEITSPKTLNGTHKSVDIPVKETEETSVEISNETKSTGVQERESCVQAVSPVGDELSSLPDFYKHIQRRSSSIDSVMSRPGSDFLDVPLFPLQSRDRSPSSSTLDETESPTMSPPFNVSCSEGADLQQQVVHRLSDAIQLPCPTPCQTPDLADGTPGFVLSTPFLPKVVEQAAGPQVSLTTEDGDDFAVWFGRRGSIFIEEKTSPGNVPGQSSLLATRTTTNEQGQVSLDVPKTIDNTRPL